MIILATLLVSLILLFATVLVMSIFKVRWRWIRSLLLISLVFSITFGVTAICASGALHGQVNDMKAEYAELVLYSDLIDETGNEYVRFDFYNRVEAFNDKYDNLCKGHKNIFVGALYPKDCVNEISAIEFNLREDTLIENEFEG